MDRPGADAPAETRRSGADAPAPGRPAGVADLERLLADPRVRETIAAIAREEAAPEEEPAPTRWQRFSAFVAGASSALVVVLAFLVPSVEEQWDRFQARRVVQKHVALGRAFVAEESTSSPRSRSGEPSSFPRTSASTSTRRGSRRR